MDDRVSERLIEVLEHGQPAHAERAQQLLDRLHDDPHDAQAAATAAALIDAYLNDPYLTR
jgi:hypothetical protein